MSDVYTVEPPAVNAWWDPIDTPAAVLDRLRLTNTDIDEPRVQALVLAAGRLVNEEIDSIDDVVTTPALVAAVVQVAVNLYFAAPGDNEFDALAGARQLIRPAKVRWGIG